ncbi:type VII toxin-antitoxin system HepT family RNase toxin [Halanaerobacter jeridensis]|uniref:Uncharacterized protein YutE (UPF0331/DUF86 family) n=1 Tax=Halanaerobacter jeridensis TaxID=706427 RepID=A0A938XTL8_9FIRM|nr:DUF86 domain-containing protein [Halanaerobacter jeridensis]MBM7557639.1 uncharacterized protein YutE (UPF0331/DUF86 family) [Halanaerobacter jeridensis]
MVNQELIHRKLTKLIQYLDELKAVQDYTLEEYLDNYFIKRTTERLIQLIVEVATDINGHIIVDEGHNPPHNYYQSFIKLGQLNLINEDLAQKLAPSTGLRNRLVHEYEEIDDQIVFESIETTLELYRQYIKEIKDLVEKI